MSCCYIRFFITGAFADQSVYKYKYAYIWYSHFNLLLFSWTALTCSLVVFRNFLMVSACGKVRPKIWLHQNKQDKAPEQGGLHQVVL